MRLKDFFKKGDMMDLEESILNIFTDKEAYLQGHFLLSSGKHSEKYVQCARVLQYTDLAASFAEKLVQKWERPMWDYVVAPAMGGLIIGHEVARFSQVPFVFTERVAGEMTLRRGFSLRPGAKVLIVEDVVTTGVSSREVMKCLEKIDVNVFALASIIDRTGGSNDFTVPFKSLVSLEIKTYDPPDCPLCELGQPLVKPGSRDLLKS